MANYTLHLGFDWDSPLIGSIWGGSATDYRFLQYALANDAQAPAWFQFQVNDALSVVIWSLSSAPGSFALALSMSFGVLDPAAGAAQTYAPQALVGLQGTATTSTRAVNGQSQSYLNFNSVSSAPGGTSPWGSYPASYTAGSLTLIASASYKLSYCLKASLDGGPPRAYVSDPEVIVGSRG